MRKVGLPEAARRPARWQALAVAAVMALVAPASSSAWSQQGELTATQGASLDYFGSAVAVSGSTAVVGAHGTNSDTGAAYVYVRSGTSWPRKAELTPKAGTDFLGGFGNSVAISGSTVVVAAAANDSNHGSAYVFVHSGKPGPSAPS